MRVAAAAAAIMLTISGPALGEPAKRDAPRAAEQQEPTKVVLASAEPARSPASTGAQPAAPAKRPIPRVTTCRCGDPEANPEPREQ